MEFRSDRTGGETGILERMGDAHCVLDRDFRYVVVNAAAERLLGRGRETLLGRSHWEAFPASVDTPIGRALRRVVEAGVEQHLTHHYTGEGYDLHVELDAYPTDEGGVALFWRDVSGRVAAEAALRESEEKYRALFNEMDEAYAVVEVLADAAGRWSDFLFLEVNPAFMRHTGMPYPVGHTARELLGTPNPRWAQLYGQAAETGASIRVEEAELTLGRVFDLNIFRLGGEGSRRVAVLFTDITGRKQADAALHASVARQVFLLRLSDTLRPLAEPGAIQNAAARVLGERLGATRVMYAEVEGEPGAEVGTVRGRYLAAEGRTVPFPDRYAYAMFGERVMALRRRGETMVVTDVLTDPAFDDADRAAWAAGGVRAAITVALVKDGRFVADFGVQSATPRAWTADEITLVEETAERTWAAVERARAEAALRASEERFRLLVEGAKDYALFLLSPDNRIVYWSQGAERVFGWTEAEAIGREFSFLFTPENRERGEPEKETAVARSHGRAVDRRWHIRKDGTRFWADGYLVRLDNEDGGVRGFVKITRDATEQKRAEEAVQTALEAVARANEQLEERVRERTEELEEALEQLARANSVRRELLRRLVDAQEEERRHVSRELHDNTGQLITGLSLGLANLPGVLPSPLPAAAVEMLERMRQIADELGAEAHRLSANLRPTALEDMGLVPALRNYLERWATWSGLPVDYQTVGFDGEDGAGRLPREVESTTYRVVQEALTNVLRHASPNRPDARAEPAAGGDGGRSKRSASRVSVLLQRTGGHLIATVEDDGPGFDVQAAMSLPADRRRLGLFGMRERAELVGGTLEIESRPGAGTSIVFRAPLPPTE